MANPLVRPHLHFYPEDSGKGLHQAWQGKRWRHDKDPTYLTPMIRLAFGLSHQDFYIHEPALLRNGKACIPYRWFIRGGRYYGLAYELEPRVTDQGVGWMVRQDRQMEVSQDALVESLPYFEHSAAASQGGLPPPHNILGEFFETRVLGPASDDLL